MKKLNLDLEGEDGNAFMVLGLFRRKARNAGWTKEEIEAKCNEAMSGDYDHLLQVIMSA